MVLNHSSTFHGDNWDRFLYQTRSLWNDWGWLIYEFILQGSESGKILPTSLILCEFRLFFFPRRCSSFAPLTALVISWTRDRRSSITKGMVLSACNATISLLPTSIGCFKPGVTRMSGMLRVRGSWSMCWKVVIPRRPLRGTTKKKNRQIWISVRDSRKDLQSNVLIVIFLRIKGGFWIAQVHCTEIIETDFFIEFAH